MACLLEIAVSRAYDLCFQWANPKSILELREGQTDERNGKGGKQLRYMREWDVRPKDEGQEAVDPCDNVVLHRPNENGIEGLSSNQRDALCSTEQEEARALAVPRALPLSIGSISLSSCQLFLCARQIVADGGDENGWRWRERGREEDRKKQGDKLTLLLRQRWGGAEPTQTVPRGSCSYVNNSTWWSARLMSPDYPVQTIVDSLYGISRYFLSLIPSIRPTAREKCLFVRLLFQTGRYIHE